MIQNRGSLKVKKSNAGVNPTSALEEAIPSLKEAKSNEHKVIVEEVLNTDKYSYLNVSEADKKYWIAISKQEVTVGDTYNYTGGLLKKNFFSKEFNRVFETVYLVSKIWKQGSESGSALAEALGNTQGIEAVDLTVNNIKPAKDAIKLSELFTNREKYAGQLVKVTGKIVKVNAMIMSRNWLHLQDGSGDNLDLTITTAENIPLGAILSLEGTIVLDKDFGSGYRFDVLMEGAVLK